MESPKLNPRVGPCAKGAKGPTRKHLMCIQLELLWEPGNLQKYDVVQT